MSNFTVSYLFRLRDEFTARARNISRQAGKTRGVVSGLGAAFNGMERRANAAGAAIGRLAHRMRALRTIGRGVGTGGFLGGMGVLGGGFAVRSMITKMMSFQDAINSVEAKFSKGKGMDPDRLAEMRRGVQMLGKTTRYTTTQVANALNMLAMAGQTYGQALGSDRKNFRKGALATTLSLGAATGADLPRAADIVTNIMSAYGVPVAKLSKISDSLTFAVNSSNQNIYELSEAMKMAGPASRAFGVSMEQTAAATMVLANAGIKASLAGTGFRRMVTRLVSINSQSAKVFKKLGIDPKEFVDGKGKIKDIWSAVDAFKKAGARPSDVMKIFGDRAGPIMLRLMTQSTEKLRSLERAIKGAAGAADQSAAIMEKGLGGAIRKMWSHLEAVTLLIGDSGMAKDVSDLAEYVIGLADSFSKLSNETKKWIGRGILAFAGFAAIAIPLGILSMAVGALMGPLGFLARAVFGVARVFGMFAIAIGSQLLGPIARAATMLGAGGALMMGLRMLGRLARVGIVISIVTAGMDVLMNWEKVKASFAEPMKINVIWPEAPAWLKWLVGQWGQDKNFIAGKGGPSAMNLPGQIAKMLGMVPKTPKLPINPNTVKRMVPTSNPAALMGGIDAYESRLNGSSVPLPAQRQSVDVKVNSPTVTVKVDASGMATARVPLAVGANESRGTATPEAGETP